MRVLHVVSGLGLGGAESLLYRLVQAPSGIVHEVVSLGEPGWYAPLFEKAGVRVTHLEMRALSSLAGVFRLRRLIEDSGADVVQCWMYRSNLLGGIAGKMAGVPVVWNVRCSPDAEIGRASRTLARISGILARVVPDFIINCSVRSAEQHARVGFAAAEGAVVPNGYDPAALGPDEAARAATREALGISPDAFLIGSITRWIGYKDIPALLNALRIARDRGVDAHCLLVGSGLNAKNPDLMNEVRKFDLDDRVLTLGTRGDIGDLARAMDLHVLSSTTEAFPNAVAETMLSGTPNVATDVGDSATIVGETGWVVPPRDPKALGAAIVEAYRERQDSGSQWKARQSAARARIVENFSLEKMVSAYMSIWQRFAHKNQPENLGDR